QPHSAGPDINQRQCDTARKCEMPIGKPGFGIKAEKKPAGNTGDAHQVDAPQADIDPPLATEFAGLGRKQISSQCFLHGLLRKRVGVGNVTDFPDELRRMRGVVKAFGFVRRNQIYLNAMSTDSGLPRCLFVSTPENQREPFRGIKR
ncbi:MAG: hypothetical protein KJN79_04410, partial [Gammaproteobacteria bacterium]|nr:hypothetical protein [Gammaproteobacteria bacterium]